MLDVDVNIHSLDLCKRYQMVKSTCLDYSEVQLLFVIRANYLSRTVNNIMILLVLLYSLFDLPKGSSNVTPQSARHDDNERTLYLSFYIHLQQPCHPHTRRI